MHSYLEACKVILFLQLTQKLNDMTKVAEEKDAELAKLKSDLEESNKEIKQLQTQHSQDLEKLAIHQNNIER